MKYSCSPCLWLPSWCPDMADPASPSACPHLLSHLAPAAQTNSSESPTSVWVWNSFCQTDVSTNHLPQLWWRALARQEAADSSVCPRMQASTVRHPCIWTQQGVGLRPLLTSKCPLTDLLTMEFGVHLPEGTIIARSKLCTVAQHWNLKKKEEKKNSRRFYFITVFVKNLFPPPMT